jgi:hypothetical protein
VTVGRLHPEPVLELPPPVTTTDEVVWLALSSDFEYKPLRIFSCLATENVRLAIPDDSDSGSEDSSSEFKTLLLQLRKPLP